MARLTRSFSRNAAVALACVIFVSWFIIDGAHALETQSLSETDLESNLEALLTAFTENEAIPANGGTEVAAKPKRDPLYNVAILPGVMGSRLEARAKRGTLCSDTITTQWSPVWINVHAVSNNMPRIFGMGGGDRTQAIDACVLALLSAGSDNVEIRTLGGDPRFANGRTSIQAIVALQSGALLQTVAPDLVYFFYIVRGLERNGLQRETDIVGLPYDWRFAFDDRQHDAYYNHIKARITENKARNGRKTVVLAHSMGNLMFLQFLKRVEAESGGPAWIEAHIDRYLAVAPPLTGSPAVYEHIMGGSGLLTGAGIGRPVMRNIARAMQPVLSSLAPHPTLYTTGAITGANVPVLSVGTQQYTIATATQAFQTAGVPAPFIQSWLTTSSRARPSTAPPRTLTTYALPTIFYYATGKPTPLLIRYQPNAQNDFSGQNPTYVTGQGDGTVPVASSTYYRQWAAGAGRVKVTPYIVGTQLEKGTTLYERAVNDAGVQSDHQRMLTDNWLLVRELVSHVVNGGLELLTAENVQDPRDGNGAQMAAAGNAQTGPNGNGAPANGARPANGPNSAIPATAPNSRTTTITPTNTLSPPRSPTTTPATRPVGSTAVPNANTV